MYAIPPHRRALLQGVGSLLISLTLYFTVLALPIAPRFSHYFRSGNPLIIPVFVLLWYPVFRRSGWMGELASLSLTMIAFAMPLSWVWNVAFVDGNTIGGLLPWNDARQYFMDAQRLLVGEPFSAFASRRPLFAGLLSLALLLTGHSLQWTLAIFGALTALACYLLARAIRTTDGSFAGVIVLLFSFLYYRFLIHRLLTEHLGLPLGALGLAFLWLGAHRQKRGHILAGIFLLTLGLNARAGAFFVLPLLVVWAAWYDRRAGRFSRWFVVGAVAAIVLGFGLNMLVLRAVGARDGRAFSNFSYSLYGMAAGYKGWDQIYKDVPGVKETEVMAHALALARANPRGLLTGVRLAYRDFVNVQGYNAFEFAHFHYAVAGFRTYRALLWISALGLLWAGLNFKNWRGSLLLALAAGVFLSIPFLPPIDAESMRAYAVTIPLNGLVVATGLLAPVRWLRRGAIAPATPEDRAEQWLWPYAILLSLVMVVAPLLVYFTGRFPGLSAQSLACPPDSQMLTVYVSPGSVVHLVEDVAAAQTSAPLVRLGDFADRIAIHSFKPLVEKLTALSAGKSFLFSLNYQPSSTTGLENVLLIVDTNRLPARGGWMNYCARLSSVAELQSYLVFDEVGQGAIKNAGFIPPANTQATVTAATLLAAALLGLIVLESTFRLFMECKLTEWMAGMTGSTQDAHTRSPQVDTPYLDKTDPWSSHGKILAWLQRAPGGSVVLDIGVATGTMARYSAGRGLVFKGVEPVASWAEAARDFYQEIRVCPIEAAPDEFIRGADVVILGDVVEHLVSPEATLRRIVSLQDAECRFYISTPNVANVWVRLSLLFGRFDYTDRGILDRTHLHFFTRKTFLAFLDCCGLQPNRLEVTPIPLNLVNPFFQQNGIGRLFHRLLAQLTGLFPTLLGYQFVTDAHQKNTALSSSMEIEK